MPSLPFRARTPSGEARLPRWLARALPPLAAATMLAAPATAMDTADHVSVLVFDASGSMWAQLEDGKSRIEIAREVIDDFSHTRDADAPIGVVSYGHTRRGDCGDIEVVLPLDRHDADTVSNSVSSLNPRGMTPLTDAMALGRDMIPATAEAADLILVTDGLENCGGDPCALAREMAAEGIDIRAHVVGFALEEEAVQTLSCVPETTGGQIFTTQSGAELSDALRTVSATPPPEPEPEPIRVEIEAVDARDMSILSGVEWTLTSDDGEEIFQDWSRGVGAFDLDPGIHVVEAETESAAGITEFAVSEDMEQPVQVAVAKLLATVLVRGEDAETGETLEGVEWSVMNLETEDVETHHNEAGGYYPVHIEPGEYRIEGALDDMTGGTVIDATREEDQSIDITLESAAPDHDVALDAPQQVTAGERFEVAISGRVSSSDALILVPEEAEPGISRYDRMGNRVGEADRISMVAPSTPGFYEARYHLDEDQSIAATATVEVTEAAVSLDAPAEVDADRAFDITLAGGISGYVVILPPDHPDDERLSRYNRMRDRVDGEEGTISRTAPEDPGEYEVRYYSGDTHEILARTPISVVEMAAGAMLDAPQEARVGSEVEVTWDGPDENRDFIAVVEPGAPDGHSGHSRRANSRTSSGNPVTIEMPDALGEFEIRYVHGETDNTLGSRSISLTPVTASLSFPETAESGSTVSVEWDGPANRSDFVVVVEPGAPEGDTGHGRRASQRVTSGNPVDILMPDALGEYEIRYVHGPSDRTLASGVITLEAISASLDAPDEVGAAQSIEVGWEGPDNRGDFIAIVAAGAPEGESGDSRRASTRTSSGNPVTIDAPDALGSYEIRYVVDQSGRTLASHPITIVPVTAELEVDGPIVAGGDVTVHWDGPDTRGDFIAIVSPGAPEGDNGHGRRANSRTSSGSPVTLTAPEEDGEYEVRYVIGQSDRTLASVTVTVGGDDVSLSVDSPVAAGGVVEVHWEGPGRFEDVIEIVPGDAPDDTDAIRDARASQGSPVQLFAPSSAGGYEVRYRATDSGEILAREPFEVE